MSTAAWKWGDQSHEPHFRRRVVGGPEDAAEGRRRSHHEQSTPATLHRARDHGAGAMRFTATTCSTSGVNILRYPLLRMIPALLMTALTLPYSPRTHPTSASTPQSVATSAATVVTEAPSATSVDASDSSAGDSDPSGLGMSLGTRLAP